MEGYKIATYKRKILELLTLSERKKMILSLSPRKVSEKNSNKTQQISFLGCTGIGGYLSKLLH